jgi:hypothetical protein
VNGIGEKDISAMIGIVLSFVHIVYDSMGFASCKMSGASAMNICSVFGCNV